MAKSAKKAPIPSGQAAIGAGRHRPLVLTIAAIVLIKVVVFSAAWIGARDRLDVQNYLGNFHHYRENPAETQGGSRSLAESLSAADAQWYTSIAAQGYPGREEFSDAGCRDLLKQTTRCENYLAWAFFPLWPLTIRLFLPLFPDPFLAGFLASNLLSLAAAALLFLYLRHHYKETTAIAAVVLLFASPFALFFETPFTESLFLFLVACLFLSCEKRVWPLAGLSLALLSVTRPNGIAAGIVPLVYIIGEIVRTRKLVWKDMLRWCWCALPLIPYGAWLAFNHAKTGDGLFFYSVQKRWFSGGLGLENLWNNLALVSQFGDLPWHSFHLSRIDVLTMVVSLALLLLGFRRLRPAETAYAAVVLLVPLISKDLMSFSRFALHAWPLFLTIGLFIAWPARRWLLCVLLAASLIAQIALTLRFVSWQWVA
jgi:hypothetical protein